MAHANHVRGRRPRRVAVVSLGTLAVGAAAAGLVLMTAPSVDAHKDITSKYTYNDHVYPIFKERCSRCHYPGGPTPMSLMSYQDALPWAESMREQLVGEKMPPWFVDPTGPAVRGGHSLTTRELDVIVTWAAGGTPQGLFEKDPPKFEAPAAEWRAGKPDLVLQMPAEHTIPAGAVEEDKTFTVATNLKEEKWVKAMDLMPGVASMVRDAVVSIDKGPVLLAWVPGHDATAAPSGAAFKIPAGATLKLQVHYKKHWQDEQNAKTDRSSIGLYFTDAPLSGRSLESIDVSAPDTESQEPRTFSATLASGARVVGLRPSFDQAYANVAVDAVLAGGRRVPLLKLRAAQPQWQRRYWLQEPVEVPKGAKIEVVATPAPPDEFAIPITRRYPLQVGVDFVAQ